MKTTNRLINEKSPYLLQHADNPVDWYPWGNEAFEKAQIEDKPIFLSIGYSTCHWCHVMAHESFEDEKTARLMNETFISIKVDREERPDIDGIYMSVCQMLTGSGGWPLTIIMTPDKKPFFAGTYFPKENRFGRPGLKEIINGIKELWYNKRAELLKSADEISAAVKSLFSSEDAKELNETILDKTFEQLKSRFEPDFGGFGSVPKFPTPHNLSFLLRYWKRTNNIAALQMVEKTLIEMRKGGIFDQIGFGFHRYSTDKKWLVPHFEKMLYDQALICNAYIDAFLVTKNVEFKKTAKDILDYVIRDMTSPFGGFYSAEDADSEGEEGKFYLWKVKEIRDILNNEETELAVKIFDIQENGNWFDKVHSEYNNTNILHLTKSFDDLSIELNINKNVLVQKVGNIRQKLFDVRNKRIHPDKDDKILTDWNALMISTFCKAAQAFNENVYINVAENGIKFILSHLTDKKGNLLHRYRNNDASIPGLLDDYSFIINAFIDLYETTFNENYLEKAIEFNDHLVNNYFDNKKGGFFFTPVKGEKLLVRQKEIYDGAIPSGNSIALMNLLRLNRLTGKDNYEILASKTARAFSNKLYNSPSSFTQALCALDFAFGSSFEIVIAGEKNSSEVRNMLETIRKIFIPSKVILLNDPDSEKIRKLSTFISEQGKINGKTAVYICRNFSCNLPVTEVDKLRKLLN